MWWHWEKNKFVSACWWKFVHLNHRALLKTVLLEPMMDKKHYRLLSMSLGHVVQLQL
jgi:hypothetical protein